MSKEMIEAITGFRRTRGLKVKKVPSEEGPFPGVTIARRGAPSGPLPSTEYVKVVTASPSPSLSKLIHRC